MAVVAIVSNTAENARRYLEAFAGSAETRLITPEAPSIPPDLHLRGAGGLLLTGGPDIQQSTYGEAPEADAGPGPSEGLDSLEMGLLRHALDLDMPVLAICRGMQFLNVAMGGRLLRDILGHKEESVDGSVASGHHSIYLSPGSKLAAILGMGGFFKVNSRHHQGLKEAQKSPMLLASAYSLEDGIIEGLESPGHDWVVGVQCHPERQDEVPKAFANLFVAFAERAEEYDSRS